MYVHCMSHSFHCLCGLGRYVLLVVQFLLHTVCCYGNTSYCNVVCACPGRVAVLQAERLIGSEGVVEVDWVISGGGNVSAEFMPTMGTAVFQDVSHLSRVLCVHVVACNFSNTSQGR